MPNLCPFPLCYAPRISTHTCDAKINVCINLCLNRVITKDVPVPNFIKTDRIVEKTVVKEKYVDKVIIKEIPVMIERVVVKVQLCTCAERSMLA